MGERNSRWLTRKIRYSPVYRRNKPRAPLRPELRRQLEAEFAPDVERLGQLLGRDLLTLWFGRGAVRRAPALAAPAPKSG
jgi:hypothetical protein